MKKPFDALYAGLEAALQGLGPDLAAVDRYSRGLSLIRDKIGEVQVLGRKSITGPDTEVAYFRDVWPIFFGRMFYYLRLYQFELQRLSHGPEGMLELLHREERKVERFARAHREFWMYYRSGSGALDEQFTREYSRARVYDPLALVIDPSGATLASYRGAWCLAMEGYQAFLWRERERLLQPPAPAEAGDYTWGSNDTDFVEWLNGIQAVGAVLYKGEPADISRLQKWGVWAVNRQVVNIYDRFKVIRNRKRQRLAFTKKTEEALEKKMDTAEKRGK